MGARLTCLTQLLSLVHLLMTHHRKSRAARGDNEEHPLARFRQSRGPVLRSVRENHQESQSHLRGPFQWILRRFRNPSLNPNTRNLQSNPREQSLWSYLFCLRRSHQAMTNLSGPSLLMRRARILPSRLLAPSNPPSPRRRIKTRRNRIRRSRPAVDGLENKGTR